MRAFSRLMIVLASAISLAACGGGKIAPITDEDMSIGDAKAPVTVVEYASIACPGCAKFNNESWAEIKKQYIDTGQARWVVREMFTHDAAWAATGFMTARCLGKDKYFEAIDAMYQAQPEIDASHDPLTGIGKIAAKMGMGDAAYKKCIGDAASMTAMNNRVEKNMKNDKVRGTPDFFINEVEFDAEPTTAGLGAAIAKAAAAVKAGPAAAAAAAAPAPATPAPAPTAK